jgi:hypothetical protein
VKQHGGERELPAALVFGCNLRIAFEPGTKSPCLGVPFLSGKHECKYPIGENGIISSFEGTRKLLSQI